MAKSFVSPGVFTNEIDASFLGPGVGAIGAALIGRAPKGPAHVPITVTNYSEYAELFGGLEGTDEQGKGLDKDLLLGYASKAYLRNSSVANVVRVLGPAGRTVNGTAVSPGYTADSMWAVTAGTGTTGAIMAMIEITGSARMTVTDLVGDECYVEISGNVDSVDDTVYAAVTASFLTSSANYIKKVLNTDPTKNGTSGYYVRDVYDYAYPVLAAGNALFHSAAYGMTDFTEGFNSGSTPWITSQEFGGSSVYNLFRIHTLGHGEAENGRFKISVKNVRVSAAPSVTDYGKFDLEVRVFTDTDKVRSVVETFPNLSLDPSDVNYVARAIGDKHLQYNFSRLKMVESGDYTNKSKYIRIEMSTGSIPGVSLPWGFRGLDKPVLMILSGTDGDDTGVDASIASSLVSLPYVADLKDKESQSEATKDYYWGMETVLSGGVKSRLTMLPVMTGSDADFSLTYVSGNSIGTAVYNASNPIASKKSPGASTTHTTLESDLAKFTVPVAFGFDGFDKRLSDPLNNGSELATVAQLGTQALRQAVDIVSDPDFIDINLLAIPGINSSRVVDYAMDAMRDRSDAFYIMEVTGGTPATIATNVKARGFDNNYAGVYYPSIKVWDDENSISKEIPASIAALGAIAFNDRVAYPWFAPAGLNRAGLGRDVIGFDVMSVMDQLTQDERDDLYEARINPIARFPDVPQGVIWGQKTLQLKASALDRINVRRLMIRAKKLVASAVKFLVFEPANSTTMTRFRQLVNPILADIQQKQGLEAFKVVMDETTSPPELIDRNRLAGKIFLIPTRTAEFISVDFVISPSGASFDE